MTNEESVRRSPMYEHHEELGRVDYQVAGWHSNLYFEVNEELADQYPVPNHVEGADVLGIEHLAVRDTAGICDLTALAPVEISGKGASEFVQRIFTNDMDVEVNRSRYTVMLDDDGGIIGDIVVSRLSEDKYWAFILGGPIVREHIDWMKKHASTDVTIVNLDDAYAAIGVWGPNARDIVQPLTDTDLSNDAFPFFDCQHIELSGIPVTAVRVSFVGELGWELWTPMGYGAELWETLWDADEEGDLVPFGFGPLGAMSAEKGYRLLGADIGREYSPLEARLEYTVDMETDFVGKEALQEERERGIDQRLTLLTMDDPTVHPDEGSPVVDGDEIIGESIRTAYGYSVDEHMVYAYLPPVYDEPSTNLSVEVGGVRHPATVREEPLFDPDDERLFG